MQTFLLGLLSSDPGPTSVGAAVVPSTGTPLPAGQHFERLQGRPTGAGRAAAAGLAKGVLFITIEDETGNVNVICCPSLVEQQHREVLGADLLGVYGV